MVLMYTDEDVICDTVSSDGAAMFCRHHRRRVSVCFQVKSLSLPSHAICDAAFVDSQHTMLLLVSSALFILHSLFLQTLRVFVYVFHFVFYDSGHRVDVA